MIGDSRKSNYLSPDVAQVPATVSHDIMPQFCLEIHDQVPPRPDSLSLRFAGITDDFSDLKAHQLGRHYSPLKRPDSQDLDKVISHLDNNCASPVTPTSFLNPKEITADQEQFADQLSKTFDRIKSERECAEKHQLHDQSANGSPGFVNASPRLCEDHPDGTRQSPISRMLGLPVSSTSPAPTSSSSALLSQSPSSSLCSSTNTAQVAAALYNLRGTSANMQHHHRHHHPDGASPGDSTSPASPSLENNNRFSAHQPPPPQRYPGLSLPPLNSVGGGYMPVGLSDMLINSDDAVTPPSNTTSVNSTQVLPTLADLTAAVTGQVIVNPTTDGFLQLFHNSSDQVLIDPNTSRITTTLVGPPLQQAPRQLTNLMSSYETITASHHRQEQTHHQQHHDYSQGQIYHGSQQQDDLVLLQQHRKRAPSLAPFSGGSPVATSTTAKRGRRRHEPTIAAAQALVNATTNSAGQLSYAPTDVAAMVNLKMEEERATNVSMSITGHHQPIQPALQSSQTQSSHSAIGPSTSIGGGPGGGYDSLDRSEMSLDTLEDELCSDPSMARIEKKRARNRLAARRCRERKVTRIATLESEVDLLKAYVDRLRAELESSQKEANQLRSYLDQLADSYPGLDEKLKGLPTNRQPSSASPQTL